MEGAPVMSAVAGIALGSLLGCGAAPAAPAPSGIDADEVRALEFLAGREPENDTVRRDLAALHMEHGRYTQAVHWLEALLRVRPADAQARVDMGACLLNLDRPGDALEQFEITLRAAPAHKKALFNKGLALIGLGRGQETIRIWEDLLVRHPGDPELEGLQEELAWLKARARAREAS